MAANPSVGATKEAFNSMFSAIEYIQGVTGLKETDAVELAERWGTVLIDILFTDEEDR